MDEMEIDGEHGRGARVLADDVVVPDLLDDRARDWSWHGGSLVKGRIGDQRVAEALPARVGAVRTRANRLRCRTETPVVLLGLVRLAGAEGPPEAPL